MPGVLNICITSESSLKCLSLTLANCLLLCGNSLSKALLMHCTFANWIQISMNMILPAALFSRVFAFKHYFHCRIFPVHLTQVICTYCPYAFLDISLPLRTMRHTIGNAVPSLLNLELMLLCYGVVSYGTWHSNLLVLMMYYEGPQLQLRSIDAVRLVVNHEKDGIFGDDSLTENELDLIC